MLVFFTLLVLAHSVCSDACVFRREIITLRFVSILISLLLFLLHELCKYSCVCSICFLLSFIVCFCVLSSFRYWPTCFGLSTLLNKKWIEFRHCLFLIQLYSTPNFGCCWILLHGKKSFLRWLESFSWPRNCQHFMKFKDEHHWTSSNFLKLTESK